MWFLTSRARPAGARPCRRDRRWPVTFMRAGVDDGDLALVFEIDIGLARAVGDRLLGRAAEIDGADERAVNGVDHRDVGARWLRMKRAR